MDAKERLRLYLEQRRELGEQDLVLDQLPVDDVLSILGVAKGKSALKSAARTGTTSASASASTSASTSAGDAIPDAPATRVTSAPVNPAVSPSSHASGTADATPLAPPPDPAPRFDPNAPASADWRSALRGLDPTRAAGAPRSTTGAGSTGDPGSASSTGGTHSDAAESDVKGGARSSDATSENARRTPGPSPTEPGLGVTGAVPTWLSALELPAGIFVGSARADTANDSGFDAAAHLKRIEETIAACTACILHTTATHPVPGEGNPNADFVCVGEAPGQNEDESGRPFVGPAGQLLNKILGAIDLGRDDVFICNVLKHRPPGNRNPLPDEVHACRPYLEQQLSVVKPRVILALGTFAAQTLLNTKQSLGALRGQLHLYFGVPLIVTYHPAALLRNEAWKRPTWQDVQLAQRILDASRAATPS